MPKVALIIGSLSQNSLNRKIANHIVGHLPSDLTVEEVVIADLPLYTQDLDQDNIASYERVRKQIQSATAVLIVSPEHNRSIPAAMKNVLDIASRPNGQNLWANKKVAVVTASPGSYGGINSGLHLRQSLQAVGADVFRSPEVYLSQAHTALDEQGQVANERTSQFLIKFATAFAEWVQ